MTNLPVPATPVRDSVLAAAAAISGALPRREAAVEAVRDATRAIEFHLDRLAQANARGEIQPALQARTLGVESQLREVLINCWEAERDLRAGADASHLQALANTIRTVGDRELDLVFEELRELGALD